MFCHSEIKIYKKKHQLKTVLMEYLINGEREFIFFIPNRSESRLLHPRTLAFSVLVLSPASPSSLCRQQDTTSILLTTGTFLLFILNYL